MLDINGVYSVEVNQRGVEFMVENYSGDIVAKQCTKCGNWHFLTGFNKAGKGFAGVHSFCKECHRKRHHKAPDKVIEKDAEALRKEALEALEMEMFGEYKRQQYVVQRSLMNW